MKKAFLFLFAVSLALSSQARTPYQDSLYDLLLGKAQDTTRARVLNQIAESFLDLDDYMAIREAKRAIDYAQKTKHKRLECWGWYVLGSAYNNTIRFADAHAAYFKSLKLAEELEHTKFILQNYNQIGIIYSYQKNSKQAYKFFKKFLDVALTTGNKGHIARGYNNMGISLKNEGNFKEAIVNYKKALEIFTEQKFTRGIVSCYSNIGVGMLSMKKFDSAQYYYDKAYQLGLEINDTFSLSITHINVGELNREMGDYAKAISNYRKSIELCKNPEMIQQLRDANEGLFHCYEKTGDFKNAFIYHKEFLRLRDSIFTDETNGKLNIAEQNYEQLKVEQLQEQEAQKNKLLQANKDKELAQQKAKNAETQKYVWVMVLISLSVIILIVILYLRYKEKNKSNKILEQQRDEIAHSKKEITDSISYALRIQQAMLPDEKDLKNHFSDFFILYRPKDIVSGDFYWYTEANGCFYLAVADCTGHGVPGGFMSMIGIDKLNHAVFEEKLTDPGEILLSLSRGVKKALKQNESENSTRDGMDICLICFEFGVGSFELKDKSSSESKPETRNSKPETQNPKPETQNPKLETIRFASANRPLWKVESGNLTEYKPTKSAIGGFTTDEIRFETVQVEVKPGTHLYLFTDGFADQFGMKDGHTEKKMSTRKLREKLLSVQTLSMNEQKEEFNAFFDDWRGGVEQIDDVCIIGIKV